MDQDFQFALKGSRIVHISGVDSGLDCNCYCPDCGGRFVAYKGKVLRPHFKHYTESYSCRYSFETSLHFLAKEIIQQKKYLDVPAISWEIPFAPFNWFTKDLKQSSTPLLEKRSIQRIHFDKVEVEKWEGNFKPDLKAYIGSKQLLIEITVTHGIDEQKLKKVKENDVPLLEVNLSYLQHEIDKKTLARLLYNTKGDSKERLQNFKWIYNPKNERIKADQQLKSDKIFEFLKSNHKCIKLYGRNKEVYTCPLQDKNKGPHKYADACEFCFYNLGKVNIPGKANEFTNGSEDRAVMCIGHKKYQLQVLLNECGAKAIV